VAAEEGWGPAARLREHLESAAEREAKEDAKRAQAKKLLSDDGGTTTRAPTVIRTDFDALAPDAGLPPQAR
jgi:hypothetical protein